MRPRHAVLLTPPKSSHLSQLLSRQQSATVNPLAATLKNLPASVANKRLAAGLSPLDATLTKKREGARVPRFERVNVATHSLFALFALYAKCVSQLLSIHRHPRSF